MQSKLVPRLWLHDWSPISLTLVINYFEIKYIGCKHTEYFRRVLEEFYEVVFDWYGNKYIGLSLDLDYAKGVAHMPLLVCD